MPIKRRDLVAIGGVLGGAALVAAKAEGQFQEGGPQLTVMKPAEASGRVASYGENPRGSTFTLSEMPEGIETFIVPEMGADRVGRLVLAAAEKGWEVRVSYSYAEGQVGGMVSSVRVEGFDAR